MTLKLHNSLSKSTEDFKPLGQTVGIYSCGPTVYNHVHIGNLSAFIFADTLRRVVSSSGFDVHHVMNFTDVDDKTIKKSAQEYPDEMPLDALSKSTEHYSEIFLRDMQAVGNDVSSYDFIRATDAQTIEGMRQMITDLYEKGFAYIADDGVYFDIEAYKASGKIYGQLVDITVSSTAQSRISNDEYDKDSAHDFALWKKVKAGEPFWEFKIRDTTLNGRPGWHIECSVMSKLKLGQPFDIHTGGIDLRFPHHENEIAQSTAGQDSPVYASTFMHNEHILVDGKKMSKSAQNFFTLADLEKNGVDPLAFRLLVLQSHYRNPTNYSHENAASAHNRLSHWRDIACLRHQIHDTIEDDSSKRLALHATSGAILEALQNDIDTPKALAIIDEAFARLEQSNIDHVNRSAFIQLLELIDDTMGLNLIKATPDIDDDAKRIIIERERARDEKDWQQSDKLRDALIARGIAVRDTSSGTIWTRINN